MGEELDPHWCATAPQGGGGGRDPAHERAMFVEQERYRDVLALLDDALNVIGAMKRAATWSLINGLIERAHRRRGARGQCRTASSSRDRW